MNKTITVLIVLMSLLLVCCRSNKDKVLSEIEEGFDEWDLKRALQIINEQKQKEGTQKDSAFLAALDFNELKALHHQGDKKLLEEKLNEFHARSYPPKLTSPYNDKISTIENYLAAPKIGLKEFEAFYLELLDEAIENKDRNKEANYNIELCSYHILLNEIEVAEGYVQRAKKIADELKDDKLLGKYYYNRCWYHRRWNKTDSMVVNAERAIEHYKKANHLPGTMAAKNLLAVAYEQQGKKVSAFNQYREVIQLAEKIGRKRTLSKSYTNLGILYMYFSEYESAREYLERTLSPEVRYDSIRQRYFYLANMAPLEHYAGNIEKALELNSQAIEHIKSHPSLSRNMPLALANKGLALYDLERYGEAEEFFQKAYELQVPYGKSHWYYFILSGLGRVAIEKGLFAKSISYCKESLEYGLGAKDLEIQRESCKCLYKSYQKAGDAENTYRYMEMYYKLEKDAYEEDKKQDLNLLESRFIEEQNVLEKEVVIQKQLSEAERRQKRLQLSYLSMFFIALFSGIIFRFMRKRNKEKTLEIAEREIIENELRTNENTLKVSLEKVEELNELKTNFLSMASHQFRTPLTSILSSNNLLRRYTKTEDQKNRDRHLDRISSSVETLVPLLDDLLSIGKIDEGGLMPDLEEFNIVDLARETVHEMEGLLKKGQALNFNAVGEDGYVVLDEKLTKHVFLNLLSNAIKYSGEGQAIDFTIEQQPETIKTTIKDNGIGIPEEDRDRLFKRFFRANNARDIQGTGLGLNIVKSYVELMHGEIAFTSQKDRGATFTITLPRNMSPI